MYYVDCSRDPEKMERYCGGFKGSYELCASSWNVRAYRPGDSVYVEHYKSSWKILWNLEQNFCNFYNAEDFAWLHSFLPSVSRSFLTFSAVHFNTTKHNAALDRVFLMPQYCPQWIACVRDSPGKPRECPVACRTPRSLDHN